MPLDEKDLERGTELFLQHLEEIVDSEPEVGDIHDAFEFYSAKRYSLGNSASNHRVGGKYDLGIDFYSQYEHSYRIGQCKIPEKDWLEANPSKVRLFGPAAISDARDGLRYVSGDSDLKANEQVRQLYAQLEADKGHADFSMTFYVVVYGRLNQRGLDSFNEIKPHQQDHRSAAG